MQQVAFELGPLTIHWYGIFVALGFLAGIWTASRRAPRVGISSETIADLGVWLIVGAVVGARMLYVVSYWDEYFAGRPFTEVFAIWRGGLVFYGGLIGASAACLLFVAMRKLPLWPVADAVAPSIALGQFLGRIGCLMNGCCYGKPTSLPWAIHFPEDHLTQGVGVHPTQLYESFLDLLLYIGLAALFRRRRFPGQVFAVYLIAYSTLRTAVEVFRGDYPVYYLGFVTPAQIVSLFLFVIGVVLYVFLTHRRRTAVAAAGT